ncbi:MAG: hypothetical protein IJF69_04880 [Clostridia bacterium]|nr:hypothetical protein [Clostridia bacterium]
MAGLLFFVLMLISCPHPVSMLFALAVHEGGHIITALLLGWGPPKVSMGTTGIRLSYFGIKKPFSSLAVSLSGCFFGALISLFPFLPTAFRLYSAGFAAMNLLPVSRLDGGNALLSLLETGLLPDTSYKVARIASVSAVLAFWVLSIAVQLKSGVNVSLLCVSVYLTVSVLTEGKNK